MNKSLNRFGRLVRDIANSTLGKGVPLLYFNQVENVGDLVSVYLVEKLTKRRVYRAATGIMPHISAVGSTIGSSSKQTHIWGSGSINGERPRRALDPRKVYALRGKGTHRLLEELTGTRLNVPLGDPAILMPIFYNREIAQTYKVGIIPHFDEYDAIKTLLPADSDGIKLIDVRQHPESFIDEIRSCSITMSSSLHGIILSDAYEIPCLWISASKRLLGGTWKFNDYFSTTVNGSRTPVQVATPEDLTRAIQQAESKARCNRIESSNSALLSSFPSRFIGS